MRPIVMFILLLVGVRAAHSQPDAVRWTRAAAQDRALQISPEILRREAVRAEAGRLEQVSSLPNPEVSVEADGSPVPWSGKEYTRRITVEQEINLRGEGPARRRVGRSARAVASRELGEREQLIAAAVDETFSRLLVARRKESFLEPLRQRAHNLRVKSENARRRETLTAFDGRLLQADAQAIEADWLGARREVKVAESELRGWLALSPEDSLVVEDDLDQVRWSCNADSAWALALRHGGGLARAAANESLAFARVQLEQRLARGNPTIGASVGRERFELEPEGAGRILDEGTFVGLSVRVPIPIFSNRPEITEARLEYERARAERASLEREVRQTVVASCTALEGFEQQRRLRQEAAKTAASDLLLIESAYGDGRIPLDEYLTLRERLVRQQERWMEVTGLVEEERSRLVRAIGLRRADLARRWSIDP